MEEEKSHEYWLKKMGQLKGASRSYVSLEAVKGFGTGSRQVYINFSDIPNFSSIPKDESYPEVTIDKLLMQLGERIEGETDIKSMYGHNFSSRGSSIIGLFGAEIGIQNGSDLEKELNKGVLVNEKVLFAGVLANTANLFAVPLNGGLSSYLTTLLQFNELSADDIINHPGYSKMEEIVSRIDGSQQAITEMLYKSIILYRDTGDFQPPNIFTDEEKADVAEKTKRMIPLTGCGNWKALGGSMGSAWGKYHLKSRPKDYDMFDASTGKTMYGGGLDVLAVINSEGFIKDLDEEQTIILEHLDYFQPILDRYNENISLQE